MAEFIKHYEILFNKANVDLKAAQNLYEDIQNGDEGLDYEVILFHLHQCAEKLIKSLLSFHKIEFPKVHDLELLANILKEFNIETGLDFDLLIGLSDYAVEGRYALIHEEDIEEIEKYISMLRKALNKPLT
jgi:HEPN domain-containing protein